MSLLSLPDLLRLAVETLRAPRPTFARLHRMNLPAEALWIALALTVVISIIFGLLMALLLGDPPPESDAEAVVSPNPIALGFAQFAILLVAVFLIHRVGRMMGGRGDFAGAILAVAWLQFVLTCFQIVQTAVIVVSPILGLPIFVAGLVVFFWLLTSFIAELHGFTSLGRVFGMVLFVMMGLALGLSVLLTLAGVTVPR